MLIAFCPSQIIFVLNSAVDVTTPASMLADAAFSFQPRSADCAACRALGFTGREELVCLSRSDQDQSCTSSLGRAEWSSCPVCMPLVLHPVPPLISQAAWMALFSHHGLKINPLLKLYRSLFPNFTFLLAKLLYAALSTSSFMTQCKAAHDWRAWDVLSSCCEMG